MGNIKSSKALIRSNEVRPIIAIILSILLLIPVVSEISREMAGQHLEEKLGYIPSRDILRMSVLDHKALAGDWLAFKVITYYGSKKMNLSSF